MLKQMCLFYDTWELATLKANNLSDCNLFDWMCKGYLYFPLDIIEQIRSRRQAVLICLFCFLNPKLLHHSTTFPRLPPQHMCQLDNVIIHVTLELYSTSVSYLCVCVSSALFHLFFRLMLRQVRSMHRWHCSH